MLRGTLALTFGLGLLATAGGAMAAGSIKGTVKLNGKAPAAKDVNMKSDPFCAKQPGAKEEDIVAGPAGQLKNVVVRISKGLATLPPPPAAPAVIDQHGCVYQPRVVVAQVGQTLEIRNSDSTLHNVHTYRDTATLFNLPHVQGMPPHKKKFPKAGEVVKFKCDVHPWMTGYVMVTDNPFFAVSGADGAFEIKDVPAGKYTVEVWHEKLGTQTKEVTVADGKPAELKLEMKVK